MHPSDTEPFFNMDWVLRGMSVIPYAVMALNAAFAYRSVVVSWGLLVGMLVACFVRWFLQNMGVNMDHGVWCGGSRRGIISVLDLLAVPVLMCNTMVWPWMFVGSTVLTLFLSLGLVKLTMGSHYAAVVMALVGVAFIGVAVVLASISGIVPVERMGSEWVLNIGFSIFPCVLIPILTAIRPTRLGRCTSVNGDLFELLVECGLVVFLFASSQYVFTVPLDARSINFAVISVESAWIPDVCRVLAYLGMVVIVYSCLVSPPEDEKKKGRTVKMMELELDVLCQGWSSLILIPILTLSPFAILLLVLLIIRVLRIFTVYKVF